MNMHLVVVRTMDDIPIALHLSRDQAVMHAKRIGDQLDAGDFREIETAAEWLDYDFDGEVFAVVVIEFKDGKPVHREFIVSRRGDGPWKRPPGCADGVHANFHYAGISLVGGVERIAVQCPRCAANGYIYADLTTIEKLETARVCDEKAAAWVGIDPDEVELCPVDTSTDFGTSEAEFAGEIGGRRIR